MLRIVPPATVSRASFAGTSPSVGVVDGKILRQISARPAASGNGNCTMKRSRRRNATSRACFRFVVRMASPR